jgi:predicted RNase H-like HicB family nuclease
MAETHARIQSEARGPHWVAWVADANGKPEGSVILVGETREEAEARARAWAEARTRP